MDTNIYSDLNNSIIKFLINAYTVGDLRALNRMGISLEQVKRISELPVSQCNRFGAMRAPLAELTFDPRRLELCVDNIISEASIDSIKEQMIKMDASAAMLTDLCGMDISEYRSRRARLGMDKATQGRPSSLTAEDSLVVARAWERTKSELNELMRYYQVGLDTGIQLNRVWAHLRLES